MNNKYLELDTTCKDCGQFILNEKGKPLGEYDCCNEKEWDDDHGYFAATVFFHLNCQEVPHV